MTAIPKDADFYDPTEAFMERWTKDAPELSKDDEEETTNETPDEDAEGEEAEQPEGAEAPDDDTEAEEPDDGGDEPDDSEGSEEEDEGEDADDEGVSKRTLIESDDAYVKLKVDGQEVEASIKDLKRLYGQEAALTRKSQEAAEIRKRSEEAGAMHVAGLEKLLENAKAQYEPYSKLNFLALAKDPNISAEELTALNEAAVAAYEQVNFLNSELDGVLKFHQQKRHETMVAQAKETHKILSDPDTGIEGWGEPLYNDIRKFATEQGLDKQFVDEIVDPIGIKILHMAMQYAKGKKAVSNPGKSIKKVDKAPKKIVKGQASETMSKGKVMKKDAAMKRLVNSGSPDDAAEAFMARWNNS